MGAGRAEQRLPPRPPGAAAKAPAARRLFSCYPQAQTARTSTTTLQAPRRLRALRQVVAAVGGGQEHRQRGERAVQAEQAAYVLRVDPVNFKVSAGPGGAFSTGLG